MCRVHSVWIRYVWGMVSKNPIMSYVSIVTTLLWCHADSMSFIMVRRASWADLPGTPLKWVGGTRLYLAAMYASRLA